jgi:hypothetical protein
MASVAGCTLGRLVWVVSGRQDPRGVAMDACDLQLKIEIDPATCSATR